MNKNRRSTQRFNLKIPIRFQRLDLLDSLEQTIVSSNVSEGGVYFKSEVPLKVGTPVRVFLNMPGQISGKPYARRCYEGRVIHAHLNGQPRNERDVGITFHFYDALATPRLEPIGNP